MAIKFAMVEIVSFEHANRTYLFIHSRASGFWSNGEHV